MKILLIILCNLQVFNYINHVKGVEKNEQDTKVTGRVFVTMFGYPPKCKHMGMPHACTLSIACWLAGGISEEGCGASPWIVACCVVKRKISYESIHKIHYDDESIQKLDYTDIGSPTLQKRNDDIEYDCGIPSNRMLSKRIIGGKKAYFGEFPWQAHIKIAAYQCGGVLVSSRFVATAAHCIARAKLRDIIVYLGELDTQDTGTILELAPAELHRVNS